jgi:hypothetical protein
MMILLMLALLVASFLLVSGLVVFSENLIRPASSSLTKRPRATD